MIDSPPWSTLMAPFWRILLRPQFLLMAIALVCGICVLWTTHLLQHGFPLIALLLLCGFSRLISQVFYFFSATSVWDILPSARRAMASLLLNGCVLLAVITLLYIANLLFFRVSELGSGVTSPIALMVLFFAWAGIAKEPAIEVVQAIDKPQWLPLFNTLNIAVIFMGAALTFTGQNFWLVTLASTALLANLAIAIAGALYMCQTRPRVSVPIPFLLAGVLNPPPPSSPSAPASKISTQPWTMGIVNFTRERAWARFFGRRLWFFDLLSPQFIFVRILMFGVMGAVAAWSARHSPPNSDLLNSFMTIWMGVMIAYPLTIGSKKQPWPFLASLPVSRPQFARDFTFRAMRVTLFDIVFLTILAAGITWIMPYKQPNPLPLNIPPAILAQLAKHPPIKGRTQITPWDIAVFASLTASALAMTRHMIIMDIPTPNHPHPANLIKRFIFASFLLMLPIILTVISFEYLKTIPQPVSHAHWAVLALITTLVCSASFWVYYNLWLTAQFHDHGIEFSLKAAITRAVRFGK